MGRPRWTRRPEGSNWGDFGPDDRYGRLNLLTAEKIREGLAEAKEGLAFCLSLPLDLPGGAVANSRRQPPRLFAAVQDGQPVYNRSASQSPNWASTGVVCDDVVLLYTQYSTQWDSFAHLGAEFDADGDGVPEKVYYNGWRAGETVVVPPETLNGELWARFEGVHAHELGIDSFAETGLQGRGVLVDLHTPYGRQRRYVGYDDLMRLIEAQGVEVRCGDVLLLHTGMDDLILEMAGHPTVEALHGACPGLDGADERLLQWISDSGVAAIASDNRAVELTPARDIDRTGLSVPLHHHCLFKLGLPLGELWRLGELARWLAAHRRHAFLLTAPPLRLPGAVGSPATPVATV